VAQKRRQGSDELIENLSLKDLIRSIQDQLIEAERDRIGKGLAPLFVTDSLEIEASVIVEAQNTSKLGFDLKVLSASNADQVNDNAVHKINLKFRVLSSEIGAFPVPSETVPIPPIGKYPE
jgi:hypothetical protein